ncbi:lytic transglycosylase domain-containing protein [uncultured Methylobacterium sp.]|uniref:lytic transglycosylase domain-containing protein n=1 Tax=uncultured Methylobacterium sp. TaxID=157278 RepID=UPI0035CB6AC0
MYLFSTPPATTRETGASRDPVTRSTSGAAGIVDAIREGAQNSGAGFDYLLATARRESGLDPAAKAGTSSATGLFQFIEQTWLGTMKTAGPKLGLSTYADAITARSDGTYAVEDPSARQAILDLRRDPRVAATMAGALTQANRDALSGALGREPTGGDLYAAHVLGARGAAALISTAQASPARAAALDKPEAASANRGLFYDKAGKPRGAAELYALLSTSQNSGRPAASGASDIPVAATAYAVLDDGGLRSMFQTNKRQGAVSDGVARLWQGRAAGEAAPRRAPSYFPRSDNSVPESSAEGPATPAPQGTTAAPATVPVALVGSPLPPRRPAEFNTAGPQAAFVPSLYTTRSGP